MGDAGGVSQSRVLPPRRPWEVPGVAAVAHGGKCLAPRPLCKPNVVFVIFFFFEYFTRRGVLRLRHLPHILGTRDLQHAAQPQAWGPYAKRMRIYACLGKCKIYLATLNKATQRCI
jgi:hypothetical protein